MHKYFRNFCTKNNKKTIGQHFLEFERRHNLYNLTIDNKINKLIDLFSNKGLKEKYKLKKDMNLNELIDWIELVGVNILKNFEQKNMILTEKTNDQINNDESNCMQENNNMTNVNIIFNDPKWNEGQKQQFRDAWLKQHRMPELKHHYPLKYCKTIVGFPPKMLFVVLPKLTNHSTLEYCFIVNFNSLKIIESIDIKLFSIANELLMVTYACDKCRDEINNYDLVALEKKLVSRLIILREKNIINENLCLNQQLMECFNEFEFNNMNIALQNLIQTIKNYRLIVFSMKYNDNWPKNLISADESIKTIKKYFIKDKVQHLI